VHNCAYYIIFKKIFILGVDWLYDDSNGGKLIATSEKALCDKIRSDRGIGRMSQQKLRDYLEFDLRIDMDLFYTLDAALVLTIATAYRSSNLKNLSKLINKRKQSALFAQKVESSIINL